MDAGDLAKLRRLEKRTLVGAAMAGILSGSILGGAEVLWGDRMGELGLGMSRGQWQYWGLFRH